MLLNCLTPEPSVRFITRVPHVTRGTRDSLWEDGGEPIVSHQRASLSYRARREVLVQIAPRYQEATGTQKTLLLDRVVELTGYERKYAITLLNHVSEIPAHILRPRQPVYGPAVQEALFLAWRAIHYPCAQRLVPFLPSLLSFLERDGHLRLSEEHFVVLIFLCPSALLGNKT